MNSLTSLSSANRSCDEAAHWLSQSLSSSGFRVLRTFDLHMARFAIHDCTCPHHGTEQCDCQMVVLLVYGKAEEPVTLVLHGNEGQTWFSLVNNTIHRADPSIRQAIEHALQT